MSKNKVLSGLKAIISSVKLASLKSEPRKLSAVMLSVTFLSITSGCATSNIDSYLNKSPNNIYNIGHQALQKGDRRESIKAFESLNSQYPFNASTQKGNLELIYAYYLDDNSAMTLASVQRYLRLYPNNPGAVYAYYMNGVENYNSGRGFLQRYFPYDMSQHEPSNYQQAYNSFANVIHKYPNTVYAQDARRRMIYLKNIMAQYQLGVSSYYYQMKAYVAAIARARKVVVQYPRTTSVKPALKVMYYSYKKLNLLGYAQNINKVYKLNYGVSLNGVSLNRDDLNRDDLSS